MASRVIWCIRWGFLPNVLHERVCPVCRDARARRVAHRG
jgi:hypothetical protein